MARCLQPGQAARLRKAIDDGRVDVDELASMSTEARTKKLDGIITDKEMLTKFNRDFEKRIITSSRDISQRKLPFTEEQVADLARQQSFYDLKQMTATERRATLKQYLDAESAKHLSDLISPSDAMVKKGVVPLTGEAEYKKVVSGLFDRKLEILSGKLAARQRKLLSNFVEREGNRIPKSRKKDVRALVKDVRHLLTPEEEQLYLKDIIAHKMGLAISPETAQTIAKLADESEAGMQAMKQAQDEIMPQMRKAFTDDASLRSRVVKDAEKMTPDEIESAAEQFANDVWLGIRNADGSKASKEQFRKNFMQQREWVSKTGELTTYVSKLQEGIGKVTIGDIVDAQGYAKVQQAGIIARQFAYEIFAGSKSAAASMDFSYMFRQGWQSALTNPFIFSKNAGLAVRDMIKFMATAKRKTGADDSFFKKAFGEYENFAYDDIRLEIMRRPNATNGKYDAANNGYGLGVYKEEQFPTTWPERAPGLFGRTYKMTEVGFNSMALRMRADLADNFIAKIEPKLKAQGKSIYDKEVADELGLLVGAMTGRGKPFGTELLEGQEGLTKALNATFFSPRFLGSQFHTLWAPFKVLKDPTNPVLQLSAQKSLQAFGELAGLVFAVNYTKELFGHDGRVDTKMGSSTFGHIIIGNNAFDITGGHGSVIALTGKMWDQRDGGKRWDSKRQIYVESTFGQSAMGILGDFFSYKTSPAAGEMKDLINGYAFGGEELSAKQTIMNIVLPITLTNFYEQANGAYLGNTSYADGVLVTIGEVVGISSKDMRIKPMGKEWKAIKDHDEGAYNKAVADFNEVLWEEVEKLRNSQSFNRLSEDEQYKEIDLMSDRIKRRVVTPYVKKIPSS